MRKRILKILLSLLLISGCFVGIYFFIFPDLTLDYHCSIFEVKVDSFDVSQNLRDYSLEYDFQKEKGNWDFIFYGPNEQGDVLRIFYPPSLRISNYTLTDLKTGNVSPDYVSCFLFNTTANNFTHKYLYCKFDEIPDTSINFNLRLEENADYGKKFYPNGLFIFRGIHDTTASFDTRGTNYRTFLKFRLGNKYRCEEDCFIREIGNDGLNYYTEKNNFVIYVAPESDSQTIGFFKFRLNTYNYSEKIWKSVLLTFLISLLAGIIVLIGQNIFLRISKNDGCFITSRFL